MVSLWKRISGFDTQVIELLHACLLVVWTLLLILPPPLFATSKTFTTMGALLPEQVWGVVGVTAFVIVFLGLWTDRPFWRRLGSMTGVMWWGFVGTSLVLGNPASTGGWVYLVFANFLGWAYIQAREVEYELRHPPYA